jgi:phenylpropionate dioxygenase-like ring-hydroxylating dioxygenase large terminal subunit
MMGRLFEPAELADVLGPFGYSRMLPGAAYTSPDVLAWERRYLFARAWTCAGRLPGPEVTQWAATAGDVGVLLTTGGPGVRGFANVCRHRGHELLPIGGTATRASIVCPYHGWAYRLDGSLATATAMREVPGFDPPHFRPGPLAPGEDAVYQWVTLVARAYLDPDQTLRQLTVSH